MPESALWCGILVAFVIGYVMGETDGRLARGPRDKDNAGS